MKVCHIKKKLFKRIDCIDNKIQNREQMGTYLAKPNTEKNLIMKESQRQKLKWTLCEMQGWRREMQDATICQEDLGDGNALFAIFDGHGGPEVSNFVKEVFLEELQSIEEYKDANYESALFKVFLKIDTILSSDEAEHQLELLSSRRQDKTTIKNKNNPNAKRISETSGCTANVVLITPKEIYIANCGDSRAMLAKDGKSISLSYDHKPDHNEEFQRIIKAGGTIEKGRINGVLNLSRGFADYRFKGNSDLPANQQIMICEPDVMVIKRSEKDEFVLMGCDGVFEKYYYFQQPLVDRILKEGRRGSESEDIIANLFDDIIAKDLREVNGCDNMSAILIEFK